MVLTAHIGLLYFSYRLMLVPTEDKARHIKNGFRKSVVVIAVSAVFMVLFGTLMVPGDSWLESYIDEQFSTTQDIASPYMMTGLRVSGDDPFGVSHLEVRVHTNDTCDIYFGRAQLLENVDAQDQQQLENASLAYRYNTKSFTYTSDKITYGEEYYIGVMNPHGYDVRSRVVRHRDISPLLTAGLFAFAAAFLATSSGWAAYLIKKKKEPEKTPAPAEPEKVPEDVGKALVRAVEAELDAQFSRRMPEPPTEELEVTTSPPPVVHEEPAVEERTVVCPACRTKFKYKVTGDVVTITCPNCGKTGKVRPKKRAAPPPEKKPEPPPAEAPPKKKTLRCPKCRNTFEVEEKPRPFKIRCPHCGKEGVLR